MKRIITLFAAALCCIGLSFAKDPVEGYWLSVDDNTKKVTGSWHIYQEDDVLYGEMIHVADQGDEVIATACKESYKGFPKEGAVNKMTVVNTPFIFGLKKLEEGKWGKGSIIDPGSGSMYTCTIIFHEKDGKKYSVDTLEMKGSIGPIGRSQFWKASTKEEAEGING